ncbi:Centrosomal protein of 76 kDa [Quaeritorhiza haematococci]|nr:Centrosomal protein of 76 kDa [Quaeritorhiza haematococci]
MPNQQQQPNPTNPPLPTTPIAVPSPSNLPTIKTAITITPTASKDNLTNPAPAPPPGLPTASKYTTAPSSPPSSSVRPVLRDLLNKAPLSSAIPNSGSGFGGLVGRDMNTERGMIGHDALRDYLRPGKRYLSIRVGKGKAFLGAPELAESQQLVDLRDIHNNQLTVGLLEVTMEVLGCDDGGGIAPEDLDFQLRKEQRHDTESDRLFYAYAKKWWNDFVQVRPEHADRLVKVFANAEPIPATKVVVAPIPARADVGAGGLGYEVEHTYKNRREPVTNFVVPVQSMWG